MNQPGAWAIARHVVRVCGRVVDEHGEPLGGAAVTLWSAPEADELQAPAAGQAAGPACLLLDRTETRPDGLFFFLDCAAGRFAAKAVVAGTGACGVARVRVDPDAKEKAPVAVADIAVPGAAGRAGS